MVSHDVILGAGRFTDDCSNYK